MKQNQVDILRDEFLTLLMVNLELSIEHLKTKHLKNKSADAVQQNITLIDIKRSVIKSLFSEDFYAPSNFIKYAGNIREGRKAYENNVIHHETRILLNETADYLVKFGHSLKKIDLTNDKKVRWLLEKNIAKMQKHIEKNTVCINSNSMFFNKNHPTPPTKSAPPKITNPFM